ncbi:TPA: transglutaminase family protein [Candidatus Poribacteria bacterium]|nr:transglutaminase family protein [Candidatus Poribacteria bacterium]
MERYLAETKFCDYRHPNIRRLADELFAKIEGDRGRAIAIFNWVRDEVPYRFDYWAVMASQTAQKRYGMCANKANLQIALLRYLGIPAGYHLLRIRKEVLRPVSEPRIYELTRPITTHVFCAVWLDGRWISADSTVDGELFEAAYKDQAGWRYTDWDGNFDYEIDRSFVVEDLGISPNIDRYLEMPPRFLEDDLLERANRYIEGLISSRLRSEHRPQRVKYGQDRHPHVGEDRLPHGSHTDES